MTEKIQLEIIYRGEGAEVRGKRYGLCCLAGAAVYLLAGCGSSPDALEGTAWKLVSLTTPEGVQYDEAAYDAIIGETVYYFETDGKMMICAGAQVDEDSYTYTYQEGELVISSADLECAGKVNEHKLKLQLGEQGEAVLIEQEAGTLGENSTTD